MKYFIRTAPYNYQISGMNLFNSFDAVAQRKVDVSINPDFHSTIYKYISDLKLNEYEVYCSPRKRSIETASIITDKPIIKDCLSEIKFRMNDFISEDEFYSDQNVAEVTKARIKFVDALISDRLQESFSDVISRVDEVLSIAMTQEPAVFVTHGFFLKVIEARIRDKSIEDNPRRLLKYFSGKSETFKFCEGFEIKSVKNSNKGFRYRRNYGN